MADGVIPPPPVGFQVVGNDTATVPPPPDGFQLVGAKPPATPHRSFWADSHPMGATMADMHAVQAAVNASEYAIPDPHDAMPALSSVPRTDANGNLIGTPTRGDVADLEKGIAFAKDNPYIAVDPVPAFEARHGAGSAATYIKMLAGLRAKDRLPQPSLERDIAAGLIDLGHAGVNAETGLIGNIERYGVSLPAFTLATGYRATGAPGGDAVQDWVAKHMVQPTETVPATVRQELGPYRTPIGAPAEQGLSMAGTLALMMFMRNPELATEALASTPAVAGATVVPKAETLAGAMRRGLAHSTRLTAPVGTMHGLETDESALQHGATPTQALAAGLTTAGIEPIINAAPISSRGPLLWRMLTGGAMGPALTSIETKAANAPLPASAQHHPTTQDNVLGAGLMAAMAGMFGERPGASPRQQEAMRFMAGVHNAMREQAKAAAEHPAPKAKGRKAEPLTADEQARLDALLTGDQNAAESASGPPADTAVPVEPAAEPATAPASKPHIKVKTPPETVPEPAPATPNKPENGVPRVASPARALHAVATEAAHGRVASRRVIEYGSPSTDVQNAFGDTDVSGFTHVADSDAIRHALKKHGDPATEASRGQLAITPDDLAKLPEVVNHYDDVEPSGLTKQGRPAVIYRKRINGHVLVVEEARTGRKQLAFVTMWKHPAAPDASAESRPSAQTSETFGKEPPQSDSTTATSEERTGHAPEGTTATYHFMRPDGSVVDRELPRARTAMEERQTAEPEAATGVDEGARATAIDHAVREGITPERVKIGETQRSVAKGGGTVPRYEWRLSLSADRYIPLTDAEAKGIRARAASDAAPPTGSRPEPPAVEPDRLPLSTGEGAHEPPSTRSGVPQGLKATQTDATRSLARKFNGYLQRLGDPQRVRFRELSRDDLPDALGRALAAFERFTGTKVHVVRNLTPEVDSWNGLTFRDGHLYVDERAQRPVTTVAAHEFTHQLKRDHPDLYGALEAEVRRQGDVPKWQAKLQRLTKRGKVSEGLATEELTANAVGDAMADPAFLDRLAQQNPSAFRDVAQRFMDFINRFLGHARTLGSDRYLSDVAAFRDRLADVLDRYAERPKPAREVQPSEEPEFQRAFHGTHAEGIDKDGFHLQHIGEGEGSQSRGWGMYFASRRDIADSYRQLAVRGHKTQRGALYDVDVPEDVDLLNWDGDLAAQSPKVRTELEAIGRELTPYDHEELIDNLNADWDELSGQEMYRYLARLASEGEIPRQHALIGDVSEPHKAASLYLNARGIPGLYFRDAKSRFVDRPSKVINFDTPSTWQVLGHPDAGEFATRAEAQHWIDSRHLKGTHNYVIWDEPSMNADVRMADEPMRSVTADDAEPASEVRAPRGKTHYTDAQKEFMRKAGMPHVVDERTTIAKALDRLKASMQSARENVHELGQSFSQSFVNQYAGLARAVRMIGGLPDEKNPALAAELIQTASTMEAMLRFGAPEWRDGAVRKAHNDIPGLLEGLRPVNDRLSDWLGWMVARRAKLLKAQGREHNLTDADIQAGLDLAKGHEAAFERAAYNYQRLKNAVLDFAQEAGVIDPEARKAWDHAEYIPFYRDIEAGHGGPGTKRGLSEQSSGIRRLKGGEAPLKDPLQNIIANFTRLIDASTKNHAALLAVDEIDGAFFAKAAHEAAPANVPLSQVKQHLAETGVDEATIASMPPDALRGMARMLAIKPPEGDDVVRVMRNGHPEYYHVTDPLLYRALTSLNDWHTPGWLKPFVWFKHILTAGATATPDFWVRNLLRDTGEAYTTAEGRFIPVWDTLRGAASDFMEDELTQDLMFAGASFREGYFRTGDTEDTAKAIARTLRNHGKDDAFIEKFAKTLLNPKRQWDAYRKIAESTEMGSRIALARRSLKGGGSFIHAAHEAKDLLNFQRRGDSKFLGFFTRTIPFLNARIQGADRLLRVGTTKGRRGRMASRVALMTMYSTALYWWNQQHYRDAYESLPEWDKDAYWHIAPGTAWHIRIPKPFELGIVGGTLPERMYGALKYQLTGKGDHPDETWNAFMRALTGTMAITLPAAVNPLVEDVANKDFYFGYDIENDSDQFKLPKNRASVYTSPTMRALSDATSHVLGPHYNISPKRLEHLWNGYTAGMGRYALAATDWLVRKAEGAPDTPAAHARDFPLVGAIYRGDAPLRSTKYVDEFYRMLVDAQTAVHTIKRASHDGNAHRARNLAQKWRWALGNPVESSHAKYGFVFSGYRELNKVRDAMADIQHAQAKVYGAPNMTPDQKRDALDKLLKRRNALARKVVLQLRARQTRQNGH